MLLQEEINSSGVEGASMMQSDSVKRYKCFKCGLIYQNMQSPETSWNIHLLLWACSFILAHFPVKHFLITYIASNWNVFVRDFLI